MQIAGENDQPDIRMSHSKPEPSRGDQLRHDIRAALADILGGLELLDTGGMDPVDRRQIAGIRASARQLARLLDTVDQAVDSQGTVETLVQPLVEGIVARWQGRAGTAGRVFTVSIDIPQGFLIATNPMTLERVIGNLLDNAFKHGGKAVSLIVNAGKSGLTATVTDNGSGLPTDVLERIISAGERPADTKAPGSGLGLYIADRLAREAGGSLRVRSGSNGRGFEGVLHLPVGAGATPTAPDPNRKESLDQVLSGRHILLVEDNRTNQLVATQMLEALGAVVTLAPDAEAGSEVIHGESFDLALIDIELPDRSGLELIADIRADPDPNRARLPLVAFTAYAMPHHRTRIADAGADGLITKPLIDIADFGQDVASYLGDLQVPAVDGIDPAALDKLRDSLGGRVFAEFLERLKDDLASACAQLEAGLETSNRDELHKAAHALIALAGTTGAHRLLGAVKALQDRLANVDAALPEMAEQDMVSLLGDISVVEGFLNAPPLGKDKE